MRRFLHLFRFVFPYVFKILSMDSMDRRMIGGMTVAGDLVGVLAGRCDSSPFGRGGALESPTSSRHIRLLSGNFVDRTASWFHVVAAGTLRGETQGVSPPGQL